MGKYVPIFDNFQVCAETSLYFLCFTVSRSLSKLLVCAILAMVTPLFVESARVFRKGLKDSRHG